MAFTKLKKVRLDKYFKGLDEKGALVDDDALPFLDSQDFSRLKKFTKIQTLVGKSAYQAALDNGFVGTEQE